MNTFFLLFCLFFFFFQPNSFFAHHDASHFVQGNWIDPFTGGGLRPSSFLTLGGEWQKGAKENKDIFISNLFAEYRFPTKTSLAVNINLPYHYFRQKKRKDASRYGKVQLGFKYQPILQGSSYFGILEGRLGFPSGSNPDQFTGGDYYTGTLFLTLGKAFLENRFSVLFRVGGIFPLTKLHQKNQAADDGINYFLRTKTVITTEEPFELKKVTILSAYLNYYYHSFTFFIGYLYRTPFEGVEKQLATGDKIPLIFKEASIGVSYLFAKRYIASFSYRRPRYRGQDFRPYESIYNLAISVVF